MIGKRIGGRYEVIKYIGGGGMSKVYLAHDVILDRDVAIKILNYDFTNEVELKRRFLREALSATSLTHPHIVNIFDVGEEGELHYLVMEYIEGQTLKDFIISNGALSPEQAIPIMRQLVSAISNAHYNGIIHRDVKPQNILMDIDGNVKITDFGIAMALSATAHTKTNSVLGTVHYLSPEQARGGMATMKSDIYSLGIVFYELLTGKLPFSGESAVAIALKHLQEETPSVRKLFPSVPQSVENVILKATTKNASNRYSSADEMEDDLATVLLAERENEEKFSVAYDDNMTRAIPAIVDSNRFDNVGDTKKVEPVLVEQQPAPIVKKKRKKWPIIIAILSGVIILALLALLLLPGLFGPKQVEVPEVSTLDEEQAIEILEELGFVIGERFEQPSDDFEKGIVISTDPEVGRKRDYGSSISLYVSIGKEEIEVEDFIGSYYTQVASLLSKYDFKSIDPDEVFSEHPIGMIISQEPTNGTMIIPSETDLILKISKGEESRTLENLIGMTEDELKEYEKTSELSITVVRREHSPTVEEGKVISQQPSEGAKISVGGNVAVVISQGAEKKPVKHLVLSIQIKYLEEEQNPDENDEDDENNEEPERIPQTIRIYVQDRSRTMTDPIKEFTITKDVVEDFTIELEEGQSGAYRITRDSMVIEDKKFNYDDLN